MPAVLVVWMGVCGAGVVGMGTTSGSPVLHLHTLDARSLKVGLVEITEPGVIHYELDGVKGNIPLDDVLVLTPTASEQAPSSLPPPSALTFYLADGGILRGALLDRDEAAPRVLLVDIGEGHFATMSFNSLSGIRTRQAEIVAVERAFQTRLASRRPGRDTMIISREGKAVVVPGSLEGLAPNGWTFRLGERTRSAGLNEAYGFVLGAQLTAPKVLPASIVLRNGNHFTARIISADRETLHLDAGPLGKMALPWGMIRRIDLRSERVVYVSDLTPIRVDQHTLLGTSWPVKHDRNVTGGPIHLGGKTYAKGLGVHAYTSLSYELGGAYERFSAIVGVDDSVAPNGSVVFRVKLDGRLVFDSSKREQDRKQEAHMSPPARSASEARDSYLRGGGVPRAVLADVRGGQLLTLECDVADELDLSDHGNWASAMLIRARSERADKTPPSRSASERKHKTLPARSASEEVQSNLREGRR